MLTVLCGRSRSLWPRIECEIAEALRAGAEKILLLTPAQYTLQAELDLVDGLNLPGLIRVQVLSRRAWRGLFSCAPERRKGRAWTAAAAPWRWRRHCGTRLRR